MSVPSVFRLEFELDFWRVLSNNGTRERPPASLCPQTSCEKKQSLTWSRVVVEVEHELDVIINAISYGAGAREPGRGRDRM